MKPEYMWNYPPLTLEEINILESNIGYKLPKSYKDYLLEQNGGKIELHKYNYDKNEKDHKIELYHKIVFEDGDELYHTLLDFIEIDIQNPVLINQNKEKYQEIYELDLYGNYGIHLMIGDGSDSSTTTMSLNEHDYGAIYRFDDHADYGDETHKNCAKISDSFEEFYNSFEFY